MTMPVMRNRPASSGDGGRAPSAAKGSDWGSLTPGARRVAPPVSPPSGKFR